MKKQKATIFLFLIILFSIGCKKNNEPINSNFPESTIHKLDSIINAETINNNLPGVVVGIWIPGEGEYIKAFGTANIESDKMRDEHGQFRIASISKTFTGLRILQLQYEGLLDIDDKLNLYFPDFPHSDEISIKNLLNMNSGIADYADHELLHNWYNDPFMPFSMEEGMEISASDSANFYHAGDSIKYCNVNYTILGLIVEQITENTIAKEIEENIFTALKMNNSIYPYDRTLPGELRGYSWNDSLGNFEDKTELNPDVPNAAGAIISNIYDLKVFAKALYTGELLSENTHHEQLDALKTMQGAPEWFQYGLGIINIGGFYGHNGTIFGFNSEMFYFPEKDAVLIINVNRLDVDDKSKSTALFFNLTKQLFPEFVVW